MVPHRPLPTALYDAAGARALDRVAIEQCGVSGLALMQRAGAAAWTVLAERWPRANQIVIVCGGGNNAGDGYVVARLAANAGKQVRLLQVGGIERLSADARICRDDLPASVTNEPWPTGQALDGADLIVDALFGTGLDRRIGGVYAEAVTAINDAKRPVLSIDIPSGLNASTGAVMGVAVVATATITFIGCKQGLLTGAGPDHVGELRFVDLDVPDAVCAAVSPSALRLTQTHAQGLLPLRHRSAHKGDHGHVLVVGGAPGFGGAARMAGEAAGRIGAGLITVATHPSHAAVLGATRPELMCHGVATPADLMPLVARASVIAIGPGLSATPWATGLLAAVLDTDRPLVIDADGLNLLAADPVRRDSWILTPHPGEAARLLRTDVVSIERDRFQTARSLQAKYGGVCVLKGAGSLIAGDPALPVWLCDAGNPGMATGGMGDVLTGVVAGLIAQGLSLLDAASLGVWLHACAGDAAAGNGTRGMLALDLMPHLRRLANPDAPRHQGALQP